MKVATLVLLVALLLLPSQWGLQRALIVVEPDADAVTEGETFWVTVWVMGAVDVVRWQGTLEYDGPAEPTGAYVLGGLMPEASAGEIAFKDSAVEAWQEMSEGVTGCGRLMAVEFATFSPGVVGLRFEKVDEWNFLVTSGGSGMAMIAPPVPREVVIEPFVPEPPVCLGDFNGDGVRDLADVMLMLPAWNSDCDDPEYEDRFDLDGDCHVGLYDVMQVVAVWNTPCP